MASKKSDAPASNSNPPSAVNKRTLDEEDSSSIQKRLSLNRGTHPVPRFLLIHSTSERSLSSMSPFFINKALQSMAGAPRSVKKLRSGDILVETSCPKHSELLLRTTAFSDIPVSITPHHYLNTSRGVISESDLQDCSDEEMLSELGSQGVVAVRRILFRRDGVLVPSRNVILTFNSPTLPPEIKAGYLNCPVRPFIPNPQRCFKCQLYGHSQMSCRGRAACGRCGKPDHDSESCSAPAACVNCHGDHPAFSRSCPKWTEEKEIQRVKTVENLSYPEARRKVVPPTAGKPSFAAVVKATVTCGVQTEISVPPRESFAVQARYMLSRPATVSAGTQSPISAVTPAARVGKPVSGRASTSTISSRSVVSSKKHLPPKKGKGPLSILRGASSSSSSSVLASLDADTIDLDVEDHECLLD